MTSLVASRLAVAANGNQAPIRVPWDFPTIQAAIENASSGAEILVGPGTYFEHLNVAKNVSIIGSGIDSTIIDGSGVSDVIFILADGVRVRNLTVRGSGAPPSGNGIFLYSSGNLIDQVKLADNYEGISFYAASNNIVSNCVFFNNSADAIALAYSNNNVIFNSTIIRNGVGVSLYSSAGNEFSSNTLLNNTQGVSFPYESTGNLFYHNNFYDPVLASTGTNSWNESGEGNFWIDYHGNDANRDGIGDDPRVMNGENRDDYPLMGSFHILGIELNDQIFFIDLICNMTVYNFRSGVSDETGDRIVRFDVTGEENDVGFSRLSIPLTYMSYPFIVFNERERLTPVLLDNGSTTKRILYFTFTGSSQTFSVVSSKMLSLYDELLDEYTKLETDLYDLNASYLDLLSNQSKSFQLTVDALNYSYQTLLTNYANLASNYSELQSLYHALLDSFEQRNATQTQNSQNIQNLTYVLLGTTAVFLVATVYLSRDRQKKSDRKEVFASKLKQSD